VALERDLLAKNDQLAARNRGWLAGRDIVALNLVSSPGSGKTTLLERALRDCRQPRYRGQSSPPPPLSPEEPAIRSFIGRRAFDSSPGYASSEQNR
jgi:hypothetical protein